MNLSQPSISAIVTALLHERANLAEQLAFWTARARTDPNIAHYPAHVDQSLQENAGALLELAAGPAPWFKQHPEYTSLTNENA